MTRLMSQRLGVQVTFGMMYALVGFIFLLAAIWVGLWFSDKVVAPVVRLLDAARRVSGGELDAKVTVVEGPEDLQTLSSTFNLMTDHLKQQRDDLVAASEAIDARRRFTEAMLAGVSAGVIGIDPVGPRLARQPLGLHAARPQRERADRPARRNRARRPSCRSSSRRSPGPRALPKARSTSSARARAAACSRASPPKARKTPRTAMC